MINDLDRVIQDLDIKIQIQRRLAKKTNKYDDKMIHEIKLGENIARREKAVKLLDQTTKNAHYLQSQKFVNKTKNYN